MQAIPPKLLLALACLLFVARLKLSWEKASLIVIFNLRAMFIAKLRQRQYSGSKMPMFTNYIKKKDSVIFTKIT